MIVNVISGQSSGYTNPNPFPGMSLAEACGMLQAYTSDAINEMNMSILLNEHAYLLENGTEIEYVNEANYQLKEKIKSAVDKVTKSVSDLWDKLVKWVQDRVEDVREKFNRLTINKKKCQDIIKNWGSDARFKHKISNFVDKKALEDAVTAFNSIKVTRSRFTDFDGEKTSRKNVADQVDAAGGSLKTMISRKLKEVCVRENYEFTVDSSTLQDAFDVVFETDRSILVAIRKGKASAIKALNELKSKIKDEDADDKSDKLKEVNYSMRFISTMSSELIKLYHLYINNNVEILHFVNRNKTINKDNDKTNLDNDKALKLALQKKAKKEKISFDQAKQRYADGDADYSRNSLKNQGLLKESSSIFSGDDRFFSIY